MFQQLAQSANFLLPVKHVNLQPGKLRTAGAIIHTLRSQLLPSPWQQGDCMEQIMHERREVQKADYSPAWEESPTGQEEERQREKFDEFSEQSKNVS